MRISVAEIEQVFHRLIERIKEDKIQFQETLLNVVTAILRESSANSR